jgi:hypothetical protein
MELVNERSLTMRSATLFTSTMLVLGLALADVFPAAAQGGEHEEHHPAGPSSVAAPAPAQPAPGTTSPGAASPDTARTTQGGAGAPSGSMGPGSMCSMMMGGHGMGMMRQGMADGGAVGPGAMGGPTDPVEAAFAAINRRMHRDMAVYAGGPDRAFAQAMVAHHQGAVDMAKVILAFGQDPEIRKLAEEVIKAQEAEITFLLGWLTKRPQ